MKGRDILNRRIGQQLTDGAFQSFILSGRLSDKFNVIFLKFDKCLHITTCEEHIIIQELEPIEHREPYIGKDSTFDYPITKIANEFSDFKKFLGHTLQSFNVLVLLDNDDITCGLKLYFNNGLTLIIHNEWKGDDEHTNLSFDSKVPGNLREKINA